MIDTSVGGCLPKGVYLCRGTRGSSVGLAIYYVFPTHGLFQ